MGLEFLNHKVWKTVTSGTLAFALSLECANVDHRKVFIQHNQYHIETPDYLKPNQPSSRNVVGATYSGESITSFGEWASSSGIHWLEPHS